MASDSSPSRSAPSWWQSGGNALSSLSSRISDALSHPDSGPAAPAAAEVWLLGVRYARNSPPAQSSSSHQESTTPASGNNNSNSVRHAVSAMEYARSEEFAADFRSRVWMTYRYQFPLIPRSLFTTDAGWGCMLRCGQSMLAHALIVHHLGRDWRLGQRGQTGELWDRYTQIIGWFLDEPDPACRYSIHNMVRVGGQCCDIGVGQWYAPLTVSRVIRQLVNEPTVGDESRRLVCHIATDGSLYKDQVERLCCSGNMEPTAPWSASLVLLLPIRLGVDSINPLYFDSVKRCLQLPHTLGIAGGKPNSALFFVGVSGDELIYLDPHISRVAIRHLSAQEDLMTYHCDTVRRINLHDLDPSLLVGFYCADRAAFEQLCQSLSQSSATPIVSVHAVSPDYDDALDIQSDIDTDEDEDD